MRRNRLAARLVTALVAVTPAIALALVGLGPAPAGGDPLLQTFALTGGLRLAADGAGADVERSLPERDTKPFSLVGVTWDDPRAVAAGTIQVRTRPAGRRTWTPWRELETDAPDESGGQAVRGASDPLWVGPSDGVQARVIAAGAARALPAGMRVDLINPDARPAPVADAMAPAAAERLRRIAGVEIPDRPVPRMLTRAAWGADERMVREKPAYTGPVQVFFVHHTATGNDYSCGSSTSVVRGIQAYQVKSKGWNDIGYNFLVDKCGTIFEGRRGGITRNVLGAHTLGFNTDASAVAVIGDYRGTAAGSATEVAVAQLAAYKLGAAGNAPDGRVVVTSGGGPKYRPGTRVRLYRISGHRDAGLTECPGTSLYRRLPAIRALAGGAPAGLRFAKLTGSTRWGGAYWTRGSLTPLWSLSTPGQLLNRFDVYVDGDLVLSRASTERLGQLQLSPGPHTVTVKALHLSGRSATATVKVIADVEPPAFTTLPQASLSSGTIGTSTPVRLDWSADDPAGIRAAAISGASRATLDGAIRSLTGTAPVGAASSWTVAVTDHAGNERTASISRTPAIVADSDATRTGSWRTVSDSHHLGGAASAAASDSAALSWTFTGRSAAVVAARNPAAGRLKIYLDGDFLGYVDLRSAAPQYRRLVWTQAWSTANEHTVKVVPEATAGRPTVTVDGLAYLR
ncbi:N-acetylmuramoyl-L-alanine amidase [Actinoplanes sp. SE50]|uniref:peptidoglycan recognition protein family protein n=1 Tax=unclassified Actinoplanes TaxID=2626549 RepID=UPI00023ECBCE|nr:MULTISPECIES: N-acetylmuramoyl-L-alanine amidase [unclassified Actinoplanes]AEV87702.1 Peptidoglycan-recognition protein-LF [Actinoplanes sp. SE50/110]ATO86105.1 N-acetylmuramoyl-L-alanine amidase [Actinoplanes sp. SE50]SLM03519.1 N-acetylmuramoyl-L-alanine amidase [Actinoplanes sp. SE50/110]